MIIASLNVFGRDAVIEYNPDVEWTSWEFYKEGRDTTAYMGKFELTYTKHWKCKPCAAIKLLATGLIASATIAAAGEIAVIVLEYGGYGDPR